MPSATRWPFVPRISRSEAESPCPKLPEIAKVAYRFTGAPSFGPAFRAGRMAEREGFEPSVPLRKHALSKRAHSTTLPPLRVHEPRAKKRVARERTRREGHAPHPVNGKSATAGSIVNFPGAREVSAGLSQMSARASKPAW